MSLIHLCLSILALDPDLSATLISGLLAAVPVVAGETDPQAREATLVGELNALHPRDLEEAMLASQFLTAHHNAQACFSALQGLDPTSREASRLRRDAMAMQRVAIATHRALHTSQARPIQQDAESGESRPTVPVRQPHPGRGKAATWENHPAAATETTAEEADNSVVAEATAKFDPFAADPSLERLRQKWGNYQRWEDMTMEERRDTFGYGAAKPNEANAGQTAAGAAEMETARAVA